MPMAEGKRHTMQDDNFVGVDVTRGMLEIVVSSAGLVWRYVNEPAGIDQLVDAVTAWSPRLVVVKADGGNEFDATCALQATGLAVLVVSPHQARSFDELFGETSTRAALLDAHRLAAFAARLYAQPCRAQLVKPLGDPELQRMQALVQRHRQLLALLMAEYQQLTQSHPSVRKGVEQTIGFLKGQIATVERRCAAHLHTHRAALVGALAGACRARRRLGAPAGLPGPWRFR
jgi:transposase